MSSRFKYILTLNSRTVTFRIFANKSSEESRYGSVMNRYCEIILLLGDTNKMLTLVLRRFCPIILSRLLQTLHVISVCSVQDYVSGQNHCSCSRLTAVFVFLFCFWC